MKNYFMISPTKLDLSLSHLRGCPNRLVQTLCESLKKQGQLRPIVVTENNGRYILIDGFKRQKASMIIGLANLSAQLLSCTSTRAKGLIYQLNRNHGFTYIEECLLIQELVEKDGLTQADVGIMLERHKSWVSRRLSMLSRLDQGIIKDIQLGLLPPGSGRLLARLPQRNQSDLSAAIIRDRLNLNESKRLVDLWFKADTSEGKQFVVKSSLKALELSEKKRHEQYDPRIPAYAKSWYTSIRRLKTNANELKQKSQDALQLMNMEDSQFLHECLTTAKQTCLEAFDIAYQILEKGK